MRVVLDQPALPTWPTWVTSWRSSTTWRLRDPLLERAVALRVAAARSDHADVATELGNLGLVLEEAGDLTAARAAYERALAIQSAACGSGHPSMGVALANPAGLLRREGDFELARATLQRADCIFAQHLPTYRPARQATRAALRDLARAGYATGCSDATPQI